MQFVVKVLLDASGTEDRTKADANAMQKTHDQAFRSSASTAPEKRAQVSRCDSSWRRPAAVRR